MNWFELNTSCILILEAAYCWKTGPTFMLWFKINSFIVCLHLYTQYSNTMNNHGQKLHFRLPGQVYRWFRYWEMMCPPARGLGYLSNERLCFVLLFFLFCRFQGCCVQGGFSSSGAWLCFYCVLLCHITAGPSTPSATECKSMCLSNFTIRTLMCEFEKIWKNQQ